MQCHEKDDETIDVDDLDRWPTDSPALDLSATTYATEISQLLVRYLPYVLIPADSTQRPLLQLP